MSDWRDELMAKISIKLGDDRFEDDYTGLQYGQMCESVFYLDDSDRAKADALIARPYTGDDWIDEMYNLICGYLHE